jgi:hypothetical protein
MPAAKPTGATSPLPPPRGSTSPGMPRVETSASVSRPRKKKAAGPSHAPLIVGGLAIAAVIGIAVMQGGRAAVAKLGMSPAVAGVTAPYGGDLGEAGVLAFVQRVSRDVSAKTPGLTGELTVEIANDASVNAFALPGQHALITVGTLRRLRSEAQLAALLAHLAAHVARGDIEAAYRADTAETDPVRRALKAGSETHDAKREVAIHKVVAEALTGAGYSPAAYADLVDVLGVRGGVASLYLTQHPAVPDEMRDLRANSASAGRVGDADYGRVVLDVVGRSAGIAAPATKTPPPPKPRANAGTARRVVPGAPPDATQMDISGLGGDGEVAAPSAPGAPPKGKPPKGKGGK